MVKPSAQARAAAFLAQQPNASIPEIMRGVQCSSGIAARAIRGQGRAADFLRAQLRRGPRAATLIEAGADSAAITDDELRAAAAMLAVEIAGDMWRLPAPKPRPVSPHRRARDFLRHQLHHGPVRGEAVEAAAEEAEIPKNTLLAATDEVGVISCRGYWRLP